MKKRTFGIIVFLLTTLLVGACASNAQTVEVTRIVQQTVEVTRIDIHTLIIILTATPDTTPHPILVPFQDYPPPSMVPNPFRNPTVTQTPFVRSTQISPTLTSQQVDDKIAACYQVGTDCSDCEVMNNSVIRVVPTMTMFINLPKDLFPKELFRYTTTISGNATMGWISNGGLPGFAFRGSPECWSTYVQFVGEGQFELRVPSILIGVPDYYVRFIVK